MAPINTTKLKADKSYLYHVKSTKNFNRILIYVTIPEVVAEINKTSAMIDKELETRK